MAEDLVIFDKDLKPFLSVEKELILWNKHIFLFTQKDLNDLEQARAVFPHNKIIFKEQAEDMFSSVLLSLYTNTVRTTGKNFFWIDNTPYIKKGVQAFQNAGIQTLALPFDENGIISLEKLEKNFSPKIAALCISWVNPQTGVIQPLSEIKAFCDEHDILLYVDATHMIPLDRLDEVGVDFLAFSSQSIHGPKGYVLLSEKNYLQENIHDKIAQFMAMHTAYKECLAKKNAQQMQWSLWKNRIKNIIAKNSPAVFLQEDALQSAQMLAFFLPDLHGEYLQFHLQQENIIVDTAPQDGISLYFSYLTQENDIIQLEQKLANVLEKVRVFYV